MMGFGKRMSRTGRALMAAVALSALGGAIGAGVATANPVAPSLKPSPVLSSAWLDTADFTLLTRALDAADASPAALTAARARPDQDEAHRHFAAAALREAFEELGVLLAWRRGTNEPADPSFASSLDRGHDGDLYAQLEREGLELAVDRTGWLSHWITDRDLPKRFDVRFFVAPMPAGQTPDPDGAEQFEPVWVHPATGLKRHAEGGFSMIFPTIRTLRQLERFETAESVLEACRTQQQVFTSCPRGGRVAGKDTRYTEDEMAFGELEMVAPDGQVVHDLDWQSERPVRLRTSRL